MTATAATPLQPPEPLELCAMCKAHRTYQYDFDKRCCRARHTLSMNKAMRQAKYHLLRDRYGDGYARQAKADVRALWEFYEAQKKEEAAG